MSGRRGSSGSSYAIYVWSDLRSMSCMSFWSPRVFVWCSDTSCMRLSTSEDIGSWDVKMCSLMMGVCHICMVILLLISWRVVSLYSSSVLSCGCVDVWMCMSEPSVFMARVSRSEAIVRDRSSSRVRALSCCGDSDLITTWISEHEGLLFIACAMSALAMPLPLTCVSVYISLIIMESSVLAALWSIETDISPSGMGWSGLVDVLGAKYEYW